MSRVSRKIKKKKANPADRFNTDSYITVDPHRSGKRIKADKKDPVKQPTKNNGAL